MSLSLKIGYAIIGGIAILSVSVIILSSILFFYSTRGLHHNNIEDVPTHHVALLLGTSSKTTQGHANPFFYARIRAAANLYHLGKVKYILASGDNFYRSYNEPHEMRKALMEYGIPRSAIFLDFAGYRTLDSIVRAQNKFNLHTYIIVSQKQHNVRAMYIAKQYGHSVHAYNAPTNTNMLRFTLREAAARILTILDLYLFNSEPQVYGSVIAI